MDPQSRLLRWGNNLAGAVLVAVILVFALQGALNWETLELDELADYELTYKWSLGVIDSHTYEFGCSYPPPYVIFRVLFAAPGYEISGVLWVLMLILAAVFSIRFLLQLLGLSAHPARYILSLAAFCAVSYYVQWDFRAVNCNLLALVLVLGSLVLSNGRAPGVAGFLLAASVAVKLYPAVLIPYFLLRRQYRLSVSALLWVFVFFVLVPLAYFGPAGFLEVTGNWARSVAATSTAEFPFEFRAFHLSLHRVLLSFLTERGGGGVTNLFDLEARTVLMIARGLQLAWLLCILSYFVWEWKEPRHRSGYPSDLINVGILSVAVLILGPELQPHHGVAVLVPAMILAAVVFDSCYAERLRWSAAVLLSVGYIGLKLCQGKIYKGLGMNLCLVLFCLALVAVRASWGRAFPAISSEAEPAPALQ